MSSMFEILINQQIILKYDRNTRLPGKQRQFFDKMDYDMDAGFNFGNKHYSQPDARQKGKYVAMQLAHAIQNNNQGMINAMCAYLANRLPALNQVNITKHGEEVTINLHFDDEKLS